MKRNVKEKVTNGHLRHVEVENYKDDECSPSKLF